VSMRATSSISRRTIYTAACGQAWSSASVLGEVSPSGAEIGALPDYEMALRPLGQGGGAFLKRTTYPRPARADTG
jgi:hypothetical protein